MENITLEKTGRRLTNKLREEELSRQKDRATDRRRSYPIKQRQKQAFNAKKFQAKKLGVVFTLYFDDIYFPDVCPVLGIKLVYTIRDEARAYPNSPSYERIDNSIGYTPENTKIISMKANTMKNSGTLSDLKKLVTYYSQFET